MKSIFPNRFELGIFVAMALVAGALVSVVAHHDTMLFFVTGPIFLVAALLGFRRSLAVQPAKERAKPGSQIAEEV